MPLKLDSGSNVTTPVTGSTEYVPSPVTVSEVCVQLLGVSTGLVPHNFTVVARNGAPDAPGVSLLVVVYVWFVS